jgi:hypothetical protein
MPRMVVQGAKLKCAEGMATSALVVLQPLMHAGKKALATVDDHVPLVNVMPFGMCKTLANPQVQAATAAAQGVLTPTPCIPVIQAPWSPGAPAAKVLTKGALTADSTCTCQWTGRIEIVDPGTDVKVNES